MTPEEKARVKIDNWLEDAGWQVVDRIDYTPEITAVAIREGLMKGNKEADYLLFLEGKAVGVLEAKRAEKTLDDIVAEQAEGYCRSCPSWCKSWANPLPIAYLSNGKDLLFKNLSEDDAEYEPVKQILTPKAIAKLLGIGSQWIGLPTLSPKGLRDCQYNSIINLENSFRAGQKRAVLILATGSGKTFTAVTAAYRFVEYAQMRKVLFLVDRNNLGKQADGEFGKYCLTKSGDPFNTIYGVERLKSKNIPKDANVVISTIQRLYSLLVGKDVEDEEDDTPYEGQSIIIENPTLPRNYFDLIIIDECHRSIYDKNSWGKVLEYFNTARLLGLTATPTPETLAFFNKNVVFNYSLEKSIVDGVNVDSRIYRIKTKATEDGGAIREGETYTNVTRYTGTVEDVKSKVVSVYDKNDLNRTIVNPAQIKLILETYRDKVYEDMFIDREPNLDYIPKTLIFALNEQHARNIVKIAREVFGKSENDPYIQQITYSAGDSNVLIKNFRNDKNFRIAVTVTLVATGTDVKPLEVVMFMRDVQSQVLYVQMKGRGCRTISDDVLRNVTPNATSKECYYLVDAVGVTEHEKYVGGGYEPTVKTITLERLLEEITHGNVTDDNLRLLASRLSRINKRCDEDVEKKDKFTDLAGISMYDMATNIYNAYNEFDGEQLPPFVDINEPNAERYALVRPLAANPQARKYLLELNSWYTKILVEAEDELISTGFSQEDATKTISAFEEYVNAHKDELEALRMIYNNDASKLTYNVLADLENKLKMEISQYSTQKVWNSYAIVNPACVQKLTTKAERECVTNIIQLVRFAYKQLSKLQNIHTTVVQMFNLWCGQIQRPMIDEQKDIMRQVCNYIAANANVSVAEIREIESPEFAVKLIKLYGNAQSANEAIVSLSNFVLFSKTA